MDTKRHLTTKEIFRILLIVPAAALVLFIVLVAMLSPKSTNTPPSSQPATPLPQKQLTGIKTTTVSQIENMTAPRYQGTPYTLEIFVADGENTVFLLRDSYDDITIKVGGKLQLIGTHKEGQLCNNDVCYDFNGKKFVFPQPPATGSTITFQGLPQSKINELKSKETTRTWQTIKSWSGSGSKTTEPFTITTSPWKIVWSNKDTFGAGAASVFQVYLFDAETNSLSDLLVNAHAGSDETFVYKVGTFYIKTNAANSEWSLAIQEKR